MGHDRGRTERRMYRRSQGGVWSNYAVPSPHVNGYQLNYSAPPPTLISIHKFHPNKPKSVVEQGYNLDLVPADPSCVNFDNTEY